jgi:hypothetical protein
MMGILTLNKWQIDPYSAKHSSRAISARYDLETDPKLRAAYGGIDGKITTYSMMSDTQCCFTWARSGPTTDDQQPFSWKASNLTEIHPGQPDTFDFPWYLLNLATSLPPIAPYIGPSSPSSANPDDVFSKVVMWISVPLVAVMAICGAVGVVYLIMFCRTKSSHPNASAGSNQSSIAASREESPASMELPHVEYSGVAQNIPVDEE